MEMQATERRGDRLDRGLGWFSLGLGVAEITAPRMLAELIGIDDDARTRSTLRAMGAREIAAGLGIFAMPRRSVPLWARVAGDALDLALLAWAMRSRRASTPRLAAACAAVLGVAVLDVAASRRRQREAASTPRPATAAITINRPVADVYAFWRDFERFPRFMSHLESVQDLGSGRSRWVAKLPAGTVEWEAEIVEDRPPGRLAWRTVEGSSIRHHGAVDLTSIHGGRRTEVRVELGYDLPGRRAGEILAQLTAGPLIEGDLRRLKQVIETGEVVHSDASIHRGPHPACPPEKGELP